MLSWNAWSFSGFAAATIAWSMAVVIYRAARGGSPARQLALLLCIEGVAVITAWGVPQMLGRADAARMAWLVHAATDFLLLSLYPSFLARSLDTPLTRPFRRRSVEVLLGLAAAGGIAGVFLLPDAYVREMIAVAPPVRWGIAGGPAGPLVWMAAGLMYVYALIASIDAWRRAKTPVARGRARAFALAFGARDLFWASSFLILGLGEAADVEWRVDQILLLSQFYVLPMLVYVPLMGYGILKAHLFDLELKVKWTIEQSTVGAAFVALFFVVSEGAAAVFSEWMGTVLGLLAAAVLVFAVAPLQRFAGRVSSGMMPGVQDTDEYRIFRKFQVYGATLESALQDHEVSARERKMLDTIREQLGIRPEDALRLEEQLRGSLGRAGSGAAGRQVQLL